MTMQMFSVSCSWKKCDLVTVIHLLMTSRLGNALSVELPLKTVWKPQLVQRFIFKAFNWYTRNERVMTIELLGPAVHRLLHKVGVQKN